MSLRSLFKKKNPDLSRLSGFIILLFFSIVSLFPLIWMFLTSLKDPGEIFRNPTGLFPKAIHFWPNVLEVLTRSAFDHYYFNTVVITGGLIIVQLLISIPAAYAFGCLKFKGRDVLFLLFLVRILIEPTSAILPNYLTIAKAGLLDTRLGVMLPYFASGLAVFLIRQSFRQIPQELIDAARIDGASDLRFLWYVGIPLVKPAINTFAVFSLVHHWNGFLWPFMVASSDRARTVSVGLSRFGLELQSGSEWELIMTASVMASIPVLIAYMMFQRQFLNMFMRSGIK